MWMSSFASCLYWWKAHLFANGAAVAGDDVVIMRCGCWAKIQKASPIIQGSILEFVECSKCWHVDIGEWRTLISAARQLMRSYIPWHNELLLENKQVCLILIGIVQAVNESCTVRHFIVKARLQTSQSHCCTAESFAAWQQGWMSLIK